MLSYKTNLECIIVPRILSHQSTSSALQVTQKKQQGPNWHETLCNDCIQTTLAGVTAVESCISFNQGYLNVSTAMSDKIRIAKQNTCWLASVLTYGNVILRYLIVSLSNLWLCKQFTSGLYLLYCIITMTVCNNPPTLAIYRSSRD